LSYIDIAFIVIAVLMVIISANRGFLVSLLSMAKFVVGVPLSYALSINLSSQIYDSTVRQLVYNSVLDKLNDSSANVAENINEILNGVSDNFAQKVDLTNISSLSTEQISNNIVDNVLQPVIIIALKIAIFIALFIVFCIVVGLLISLIKKLQNKKHMPLKRTNKLFGGIFGLIKAVVFIYTLATIIGYITNIIPQDNAFVQQANSSAVLNYINDNNPFLI
jgi:uncharacterized membrane protein required for colicin V production